jgi:hypothetical protein
MFCHYCPLELQTTRHFIFLCPWLRQSGRRFVTSSPFICSVTSTRCILLVSQRACPRTALWFSPSSGHAVAIHTLWLLHCQATYNNHPVTIPGARALYRANLLHYLETLWASASSSRRDQLDEDWFPPLASASSSPPFNLVYI